MWIMRIDDIDDDDDQELEEAEERSKMAEDQIEGMRRVRGSSVLVSMIMLISHLISPPHKADLHKNKTKSEFLFQGI